MVQGGKEPGDVKGSVVGCGVGGADANVFRGEGHRGDHRPQVQLDRPNAVLHRRGEGVFVAVRHGQTVIDEGQVELALFQRPGDVLVVAREQEII